MTTRFCPPEPRHINPLWIVIPLALVLILVIHIPLLRSKHSIRGTVKQHPDQASDESKEADFESGIVEAAMSDLSYQPSSSEEEEFNYESYASPKAKDGIQVHEVTLSQHHLGDCTHEAGTLICNGETMELHDGSFLMITELGKSKNGYSVTFDGHLFRPVDLEQYLPATFDGTEVVWLCEAKEHDPKSEGYLGSASSKGVLCIRHLVVIRSNYVAEFPLQTQAIGKLKDTRPPICQWMSVAELSVSRDAKSSRSCQSIEKNKGSQGLSKAFIALSSEESFPGGIAAADISRFQHHLSQLEATSHVGSCQTNRHELPRGRNPAKGKDRGGDVLAPITSGSRIAKATCNSARPSYHLACHMLGTSSAQPKVLEHDFAPSNHTFADAFCGAGGMPGGARDTGLHIKWAFDHDGDAVDTYALSHGQDTFLQILAEKFLEEVEFAYEESYVDVLHLSPPSQGFALARRGTPRSEANNNKCVTSVDATVEKVKPRIVTFEEVPQVLFRHREYSTTVARNLTSIGYNIRWRTLECVNFGVPQKRMRPFVMASCLGEPLPDFPEPTHAHLAHCEHLRLQPWNSFEGAIDNLEDRDPNYLHGHRRKKCKIETWARHHPADWPCRGTVKTGEKWADQYNGE